MKNSVFKIATCMIPLLMLPCFGTVAYAEVFGDFTYTVLGDSTIAISDYAGTGGNVLIPDNINGTNVTSIESWAFYQSFSLASITIPDSITNIGDSAFRSCSALTNAFIGANVTSVGAGTFYQCYSLASITIPDSVTSIGDFAFTQCSSLTNIAVGLSNANYSDLNGALLNKDQTSLIECPTGRTGAYVISNSVTSIGSSAFDYCSGLTSITIPDSITNIGSDAFQYCSGLTSITIPDSVTSIGSFAFDACSGLTSITIPDSITSIGNYTFRDCSELTFIAIPASVTNLGNYAFASCSAARTIRFDGNAPTIGGSYTLWGCWLATVYYRSDASGFGATFGGIPTAVFPKFTNVNFTAGSIVMNTQGPDGEVYVLQVSTNLTDDIWTSLETNTVSSGSLEFSLPTIGSSVNYYRAIIEL